MMTTPNFTLENAAECVSIYGDRAKVAALSGDREAFITEMLHALHSVHTALAAARDQEVANHG